MAYLVRNAGMLVIAGVGKNATPFQDERQHNAMLDHGKSKSA
jgi:hypothetical protein